MSLDPTIQQERREDCRRQVRRYLAERQSVALHPRIIQRRLNEGHANDFEEADILAALTWLEGAGQVKHEASGVGATRYYQATSAGVLEHERNPL